MPAPRSLVALVALVAGCSQEPAPGTRQRGPAPVPEVIELSSPSFPPGGDIPGVHSCEGENLSPALAWTGVPDGAAELALVVEDPDAPGGTFVHWVVLGIDADLDGIEAGQVPAGAREGRASSEKATYIGPCPPDGERHRYVFGLYALGSKPDVPADAPAAVAVAEIRRVAVAKGELHGRFAR